ncbi:hypothetical protein ACQ4PT_044070 [Festuca glaucescens]
MWAKEAPKATRNFVQLCLEGYYDGTLFHRVIKSFLIQGGDPTGSGTGEIPNPNQTYLGFLIPDFTVGLYRTESWMLVQVVRASMGPPFSDEFHSRLRFNHRGLLACANAGTPHSNGSQFFITLDRCDWLDKKNTIFGKVTGDSVFNLLALADIETNKDDRPVYPQKILSVEVLWNPFDDIVPRQIKKIQPAAKADAEGKPKKKAVKQLNVLSFGDEVEEENEAASFVKDKIKSIHDVLDDPRFLKVEPQVEQLSKEEEEKKNETVLSIREALISKKTDSREPEHDSENDDSPEDENEEDFDNRMRSRILKKRRELGDTRPSENSKNDNVHRSDDDNDEEEDDDHQSSKSRKLSLKKKGIGSEANTERMSRGDVNLQLLNPAEQEKHLKKQRKRSLQGREEETLARLQKFKASFLSNKPANMETKADDGEGYKEWHANRLTFETSKDGMTRKDDPNDYVVVDPLLEKGKQKFNKMQAKLKKRDREWAGRSLT